MLRPYCRALLPLLILVPAAGCRERPPTSEPTRGRWQLPLEDRRDDPFPRAFLDSEGKAIAILVPPRRIASGTVFSDAVLLDVCPHERIVALTATGTDPDFSIVSARTRAFPRHITGDPESILATNPDLVFLSSFSDRSTERLIARPERQVVRLHQFQSLTDIQNNIRAVGYVLGLDAPAERLVAQMQSDLARARATVGDGRKWRLLSWSGGYVAGRNTIFDSLVREIGATNVAADGGVDGHSAVTAERILAWNPDGLVVGVRRDGEEATRKLLQQSVGLQLLSAVKQDRIVFVPNSLLLSTSHHLARAATTMADTLSGWEKE